MRGVTLLWALRSPCNLNCQYCYFGTLGGEQDRTKTVLRPGELSHVGRTDILLDDMLNFIAPFTPQLVHRVFVAGGEPLIWRGTFCVLSALKQAGCEVIVCTNGLPLTKEPISTALLDLPVNAVSISLDSFERLGQNYRITEAQAHLGHAQLQALNTTLSYRRWQTEYILKGLTDLPEVDPYPGPSSN